MKSVTGHEEDWTSYTKVPDEEAIGVDKSYGVSIAALEKMFEEEFEPEEFFELVFE